MSFEEEIKENIKEEGFTDCYESEYPNEDSNSSLDKITDSDFIKFVGLKNTEHYFNQWKNNENKNTFSSWNWASFFLGGYWLLYRKLYAWFVGVTIVDFIAVAILDNFSPLLAGLIPLIIMILLGIFGNCIYIRHSKKKILSLKKFFDKYGDTDEALKANGGTTLVAPLVLLASAGVIAIIVGTLLTTLISSMAYSFPF
ncbi:DUF2628 domain-containing protein [Clostridium sardiniense]|uniref:DUF2628 domain-containing protein n=1 Tax=Clostridium sardiniense TaxID=29369 RepID=UPI003D34C324